MATRGRKPKPPEIKILTQSRADRINTNTPAAVAIRPECPDHLCDVAKEEWDRIVPILETFGVLSRTDGTALAIYCATYARWVNATIELSRPGAMTSCSETGVEKVSPFVQIASQAEQQMARMLVEFGCTPSSRSRVSVLNKKPADPLAKFSKKA